MVEVVGIDDIGLTVLSLKLSIFIFCINRMQSNTIKPIESITKDFGNLINSMIARLIQSIENQSNNCIRLNLIDLAAN